MAATKQGRRLREERLGFRVGEPTKALIERAAQLERRKLTDFCMTALADATRRPIAEPAFGEAQVHRGEAERQHRCSASVPAFNLRDLDAQRLEGGRGPHSVR